MSDFDYRRHKIIGVARKKSTNSIHASIYPLGYQDNNYHFQPFNREEQKTIFLHNGTVFGYNFRNHLTDKLIVLCVKENEIKDDPTKDVYSADYETRIEPYAHTPIVNINKAGLKDAIKQEQYNSYFKVGNRIYHITKSDAEKGIAKYWSVEDGLFEANRNLCRCEDDIYLIRDNINYQFKFSDILSNEEIISFIIELVRLYNIDPQHLTSLSDELIKKIGLPSDILQFRFDVFNELLPSIVLTHKNIYDLASNPLLTDVLQRSIKEYEDEYIRTYEEHHRELINKIEQSKEQKLKDINNECEEERKTHMSQLKSIADDIVKEKLRLNEISERIKKKEAEAKTLEQRFADIEEHKGRLIEDFAVIKDVIGGQTHASQQPLRNNTEKVTSGGEPFLEFEDFCSHIVVNLLRNGFSEDSAIEISKDISRLFVAKNSVGKNLSVILLPSLKIFKSLIDTIGQYRLCSVGVVPNWKSYGDLYYNALGEMLISAMNNPNELHIILLQNMNLSYIPSYMQPINDILIGITNKLPGDNDIGGIPSNLWIFGTRTGPSEEAIPISMSNIEEYGCLENKEYTYSKDKIVKTPECKFVTMDFVNVQREEERRYKSSPDSYID